MKNAIAVVLVGILAAFAVGDDAPLIWPRFRGSGGAGIAAEGQRPPLEFGLEKNLKWKVPVPNGFSSPIIVGDKLVITSLDEGKLYTIAYRRDTGVEAWRAEALAKQLETYHKSEGSPAASTPATDGARIVSYFGSCGLFCYDLTGKELWKLQMPPAVTFGDFGSGVSPIFADGLVVLVRDQTKESKILAVDAASGAIKWETPRHSPISYCTPVVWDTPGGRQIAAAGHARIIGYDLMTGAERWSVMAAPSGCCSSPVVVDGTLFFAGTAGGGAEDQHVETPSFDTMLKDLDTNRDGFLSRDEAEKAFEGFFDNQDANKDGTITRNEWDTTMKLYTEGQDVAFALQAGGKGDVTASHLLWKQTRGLPYVASAIVYQGQCLMVKDGGIVTSYDARTGNQIFQARVAATGTYYASPVAANGFIYFTSLDGAVTVLKAGSPQPVVVAKNLPLNERTAATPAIADNTIYLRTEKYLYAFAE